MANKVDPNDSKKYHFETVVIAEKSLDSIDREIAIKKENIATYEAEVAQLKIDRAEMVAAGVK